MLSVSVEWGERNKKKKGGAIEKKSAYKHTTTNYELQTIMQHQYAIDTALLLDECLNALEEVIDADERQQQQQQPRPSSSSPVGGAAAAASRGGDMSRGIPHTIISASRSSHLALYDMKEVLIATERILYKHFLQLLDKERTKSSSLKLDYATKPPTSLAAAVKLLQSSSVRSDKNNNRSRSRGRSLSRPLEPSTSSGSPPYSCYYPKRSATDTQLFRLIVALQLCLVRIGDARYVITGSRQRPIARPTDVGTESEPVRTPTSSTMLDKPSSQCSILSTLPLTFMSGSVGLASWIAYQRRPWWMRVCNTRTRSLSSIVGRPKKRFWTKRKTADHSSAATTTIPPTVLVAAKAGCVVVVGMWLRKQWNHLWMTTKIRKSTEEINRWNHQWYLERQSTTNNSAHADGTNTGLAMSSALKRHERRHHTGAEVVPNESRGTGSGQVPRLVDSNTYTIHDTMPKVSPELSDVLYFFVNSLHRRYPHFPHSISSVYRVPFGTRRENYDSSC